MGKISSLGEMLGLGFQLMQSVLQKFLQKMIQSIRRGFVLIFQHIKLQECKLSHR